VTADLDYPRLLAFEGAAHDIDADRLLVTRPAVTL
jgi:hypothetical protein